MSNERAEEAGAPTPKKGLRRGQVPSSHPLAMRAKSSARLCHSSTLFMLRCYPAKNDHAQRNTPGKLAAPLHAWAVA